MYYDPSGYEIEDNQGKTRQLGEEVSRFGVVVGEDGQNTVYRVIRPDEDPNLGITAKNPDANYKVEGHVLNGSKDNFES